MSVKKLLCNPPAERVAANGDPEVEGLFIGAGDGALSISESHPDLYAEYTTWVMDIEGQYMQERKSISTRAINEMNRANRWLVNGLRIES